MKTVGIVTTWFHRGAAMVSYQYMKALQGFGAKVFVYARGGESFAQGDPFWDIANVFWSGDREGMGRTAVSEDKFEKWLRENGIDAVLFNEQHDPGIVAWCRKHGVEIWSYIDYYTVEDGHMPPKVFSAFDGLLCNTRRHYSAFSWHPNCHYIPWGTLTDLFVPQYLTRLHGSKPVFFHNAGMYSNNRKGTLEVLKLAQLLAPHGAKFVLHSQQAMNVDGLSNIEIVSGSAEPPGFYQRGDVCLYPARLDGIGLTVCEALSCGLPLIVPDGEPWNEFVTDGVNGLTVKIKSKTQELYYWPFVDIDFDDFTAKAATCLEQPGLVLEQKMNARKSALEKFDWLKNSEPLAELFK
ncbi:MAG: hypothetical protein A2X49_05250 [Lentisphaerae bacterium GWF2_52_8]|nr:MAG: hypothetical protein A2X49_05250 [Lentisphaerae bacterium GWF2_52_8]